MALRSMCIQLWDNLHWFASSAPTIGCKMYVNPFQLQGSFLAQGHTRVKAMSSEV